ncbi:MAG: flagellar assembly protein FliW [Candidatus Zixiibacteriota bacterium]
MLVLTERFGQITVPDDKIITMKKPILGFERLTSYCLVEHDDFRPFLWLQSIEEPAVAFVVVNPAVLVPDYGMEIHSNEVAELMINRVERVETYVVVTIPSDITRMSVNLQGPILVNTENNLAKQLVLTNSDYRVCHRLLDLVPETSESVEISEGEMVSV